MSVFMGLIVAFSCVRSGDLHTHSLRAGFFNFISSRGGEGTVAGCGRLEVNSTSNFKLQSHFATRCALAGDLLFTSA